jgi:hypothetical protein
MNGVHARQCPRHQIGMSSAGWSKRLRRGLTGEELMRPPRHRPAGEVFEVGELLLTFPEWELLTGINRRTLRSRVAWGWTASEVLIRPVDRGRRRRGMGGEVARCEGVR